MCFHCSFSLSFPPSVFLSFPLSEHALRKGHVRTSEKVALCTQEEAFIRKQISLNLDLGLVANRTVEKIDFCCLSHPVYDDLLWKLEQTRQ